MPGDYEVGFGKPPKHTQFKKGQSGNRQGRPKSRKPGSTDVAALLDTPLQVTVGGNSRKMSSFEVGVRQLAKRALEKDLRSILKFIKLCEEYGVICPPPAPTRGGVIVAPKGVDLEEWVQSGSVHAPDDSNFS